MKHPSPPIPVGGSAAGPWLRMASLAALLLGVAAPWLCTLAERRRRRGQRQRKDDIHVWEAEGGRAREA